VAPENIQLYDAGTNARKVWSRALLIREEDPGSLERKFNICATDGDRPIKQISTCDVPRA